MPIFDSPAHFFSQYSFAVLVRSPNRVMNVEHLLTLSLPPFFEAIAENRIGVLTHFHVCTLVAVFQKLRPMFGLERILFGTASSVFPRDWRKDFLKEQKRARRAARFSAAEILQGGNGRRLLSKLLEESQ
ncbi:MAG: hypothetical protein ALAOOOJD_00693 [bacterium]|nr:hypothetical protein [bacterium]